MTHEVSAAQARRKRAHLPSLVQRPLELAPDATGESRPCLAGNVLVYLTDTGRLVAVDMGGDATLFLAAQVKAAALRIDEGCVVGALRTEAGVRYLAWDVRDLRDALRRGTAVVPPVPVPGTRVHLLGLPQEGGRLQQGSGLLRLEVARDSVSAVVAETYQKVTGAPPGDFLIRRAPNPLGPMVHHANLRPQTLHQVPVAVPGGVLMLGQLRWRGQTAAGALLIPTVGALRAVA